MRSRRSCRCLRETRWVVLGSYLRCAVGCCGLWAASPALAVDAHVPSCYHPSRAHPTQPHHHPCSGRWRCWKRQTAGCWFGTLGAARAWCPPPTCSWTRCTSRCVGGREGGSTGCGVKAGRAAGCAAGLPSVRQQRARAPPQQPTCPPSCLPACRPPQHVAAEPAVCGGGRGCRGGGRVSAAGERHADARAPPGRERGLWRRGAAEQGRHAGQHLLQLPG